jgi:hypothetical protein
VALNFYGNWNENHELGTGFFVHKRIISAVKRVEFVSDRMSFIILRGCWCHVIVLNVHAATEDKIDDVKDSFYEDLEIRDFSAKGGREDIFKLTIKNKS